MSTALQLLRAPPITLSPAEATEYRLGAALLDMLDPRGQRSGLAWEVSQEIERAMPAGVSSHGGLLVPESLEVSGMDTRAGLDTATATKGAELKFQRPGPFIDALRKKAVTLRLGATELTGLTGDVVFPRLTTPTGAVWSTQNPGSNIAQNDPALDKVPTLVPHTLMATTAFSRQLLVLSQVSENVELMLRNDIALDHAVAIDAAALYGTGTGGQPTGIINTTGIGNVAGGTNGLTPTWPNVIALELAVAAANADADPSTLAYVTSPELRNTMRKTDRTGATTGWFIIFDGNGINGYPVAVTKSITMTLIKGTSTIAGAIIFGQWSELVIGLWGALELVVDPFTIKKQAMVEVTSFQLCDITVRHPVSFAAILDALQ